ncbi:MAG: putative toxin-antitoxin system toxin component, PIN family [Bryobacteraceae bacterium]
MNRVILDTNCHRFSVARAYRYASRHLVARSSRAIRALCFPPLLAEHEEVLRRPRLKLQPRHIDAALAAIRKVAHPVAPTQTLSISAHESDNRFLECAQAAGADYLVTGNTRHFPQTNKGTKVVTGRQFLDTLAESENP